MKTRTVVLEVEVEGGFPDAIDLRDEVEKIGKGPGATDVWCRSHWRVRRAEVLEERQP